MEFFHKIFGFRKKKIHINEERIQNCFAYISKPVYSAFKTGLQNTGEEY
jgi:hypothetical protein